MIEINNLTNYTVDKKVFSTVAKIVLKGENRVTETISLAFVNKAEIKKINNKFRGKNKPTDVLSFNINERNYLGEIVICPDMVKPDKSAQRILTGPSQSRQKASLVGEDMIRVFIHGILHLCGYDHPDKVEDPRQRRDEKSKAKEKVMEAKEREYLSVIKF